MQSSNPPRSFQEKRKTQIGINNDNKKKVNENMRYEELKMTMRKEWKEKNLREETRDAYLLKWAIEITTQMAEPERPTETLDWGRELCL